MLLCSNIDVVCKGEDFVNLVGRLSLGERLDADLVDVGTDKRNPNGITRCLSMTVNKDQHQENRTKIKVISIMSGDRSF